MEDFKDKAKMQKGLTLTELLVASSIALFVVGGVFALWFMTQGIWTNEMTKSASLQKLQFSIERIKREIKISDGSQIFLHTGTGDSYDAVSLPIALDDGYDPDYDADEDNDGFTETDSSTADPITGVKKIYWDKTVIYHVYHDDNDTEDDSDDDKEILLRTVFTRDNSLTDTQRQTQLNEVAEGVGPDTDVSLSSILNCSNWEGTRSLFEASSISLSVDPRECEFDGYSSTTKRTENLIDFGGAILTGGYHAITFEVIDTNSAEVDGYGLGIDILKLTPSGGTREGENYVNFTHPDSSSGIPASSGDTAASVVDMHESPYGVWSADKYLNYAANAVGNSITLRFYYDRWYETTFLARISNKIIVEYSDRNGIKDQTSGSEEYTVRLDGYGETWDSVTQTQAAAPTPLTLSEGEGDITYRNLILADYSTLNGMMLSVKFRAGSSHPLTIASAHIIQRDESGSGSPDDGSSGMPPIRIIFTGCGSDPRNQGQGVTTSTGNDVTIPAGCYAWSNWIQLSDNGGTDFNFDNTKDYFVSIYIPIVPSGQTKSILYWQDPAGMPQTHSYWRTEQYDSTAVWGGAGTAATKIYGVEEVYVTYLKNGYFISQIFDTTVADPVYSKMQWTATTNPDATLTMEVRSSDNKETLESDNDWTSVTGTTVSSSPGDISAINGGQYVQSRADFAAIPGGTTTDSYDQSCVLKDVSIYWLGDTSLVDVGSHLTKRSDYGIFTVDIDGRKLTKGFVVKLSIEETLTTGESVSRSETAEVEPRNTNK